MPVRIGRWTCSWHCLAILFSGLTVALFLFTRHAYQAVSSRYRFCNEGLPTPVVEPAARNYGFRVVGKIPHDRSAFTQGLLIENGRIYESTGLYGHSSVREIDMVSGGLLKRRKLDQQFFGEGLASFNGLLYQLTLNAGEGRIYRLPTLESVGRFPVRQPAWGLASDGNRLILSDGSERLYFLDPETFEELRFIEVRDSGRPIRFLNELEFIEGEIWANIWGSDHIARIRAQDGTVVGWLDLSGCAIRPPVQYRGNLLNGIAYDRDTGATFVTGKRWPWIYQIEITERTADK